MFFATKTPIPLNGSVASSYLNQAPNRGSRLNPAQLRFRELLGKVGSGEHTSSGLSLAEAEEAMDAMLLGQISDAQLGAFLIAHRIRRTEPQELAGMLASYQRLGPQLHSPERRPLCFGVPYDGRSRTAPLLPLTALGLVAAGEMVVLSGGNPMPVKWGITLAELFSVLGLDWRHLSLLQVQQMLLEQGLALCHQPQLFPAAERLLPVRDQIGKRPPVASLELLWTPHCGEHLLVSGYVHPPTEARAWAALELAGEKNVITIKGLEGSTDLPLGRACIVSRSLGGERQRLILHPRDHGFKAADSNFSNLESWCANALAALGGSGPLAEALHWNLGAMLWLCGREQSLELGLAQAEQLIKSGALLRQLGKLRKALA